MLERGILISYEELRILLYVTGVREIEGVYMPEHVYTDQEVLEILHRMTKRGIVSAHDDGFEMRGDVQKMIDIMGRPEHTFILDSFFCYVAGEDVVVSERYWKKKDTLKIQIFSTEDFTEWKEQIRDDDRGD